MSKGDGLIQRRRCPGELQSSGARPSRSRRVGRRVRAASGASGFVVVQSELSKTARFSQAVPRRLETRSRPVASTRKWWWMATKIAIDRNEAGLRPVPRRPSNSALRPGSDFVSLFEGFGL